MKFEEAIVPLVTRQSTLPEAGASNENQTSWIDPKRSQVGCVAVTSPNELSELVSVPSVKTAKASKQ